VTAFILESVEVNGLEAVALTTPATSMAAIPTRSTPPLGKSNQRQPAMALVSLR
jgi:hypothetical protein